VPAVDAGCVGSQQPGLLRTRGSGEPGGLRQVFPECGPSGEPLLQWVVRPAPDQFDWTTAVNVSPNPWSKPWSRPVLSHRGCLRYHAALRDERETLADHAALVDRPGGRIAFRFQARDVNLVIGPATRGAAVPFRVLLAGTVPGDAHGFDVDDAGNGGLPDQRLYQLVRHRGEVRERTIEIVFPEARAEVYCFTFG
jgi:Thioredoxin like C-terminal domain